MKKTYESPMVYYENFKLSANIATCVSSEIGATNSDDINTCGFKPEGARGYVFANSMCRYFQQDGDISFFCYHTMNADMLFTS